MLGGMLDGDAVNAVARLASMPIATVNPATGETVRAFDAHSDGEVDAASTAPSDAFARWRPTPVAERAAVVARAAETARRRARTTFGRLMTLEMGKPLRGGREEAAKCALGCRYYAEHAARVHRARTRIDDGRHGEVRYQPLGAVLAVMPWNFPFWQVVRFAAPALVRRQRRRC